MASSSEPALLPKLKTRSIKESVSGGVGVGLLVWLALPAAGVSQVATWPGFSHLGAPSVHTLCTHADIRLGHAAACPPPPLTPHCRRTRASAMPCLPTRRCCQQKCSRMPGFVVSMSSLSSPSGAWGQCQLALAVVVLACDSVLTVQKSCLRLRCAKMCSSTITIALWYVQVTMGGAS